MKNATILLSLFVGAMLTSCADVSPTRVIGDTAGAAGGALVGQSANYGSRRGSWRASQRNAPRREQRVREEVLYRGL